MNLVLYLLIFEDNIKDIRISDSRDTKMVSEQEISDDF